MPSRVFIWAAEALPGTSDPEGSRLPLAFAAPDAVEDWAAEALPGTSDPEGSRLPLALAAPAAETGKRGG